MASSPVFESDYLQRRFNERKAEARTTRQASEHQSVMSDSSQRRLTAGRDDNIFDDPDILPTGRRSMSNRYQSSPNGLAGQRSSTGRKTSIMGGSVVGTPRMKGMREMEESYDKLDKQNFDLKLEIDNRRAKVKELEKKLIEMDQLRAHNDELRDINQDLLHEMDKRDRAIDEAVVMICDLEAKVRSQQEEIDDARPRTARQGPAEAFKSSPHHIPFQSTPDPPTRTESKRDERSEEYDRTRISPDVSARMTGITEPAQSGRQSKRPVPSFIEGGNAATDALRSMYVEGNKQVRPIPSYASLLSTQSQGFDDGRDSIKSPALSELSESDFKSLYGDKEDPKESIANRLYGSSQGIDNDADAASYTSSQSQRSRLARTDRWVNERGIAPTERPKSSRQTSEQFQSLGTVLHEEEPSLERRRTRRVGKGTEDSITTAIRQNPVFGQHHLPPTPDTMLTGPSNKSSSSIIRERSMNDNAPLSTKGLSSMISPSHADEYFAKGTFLPKDADAYGSDSDDNHGRKKKTTVSNNSFGESLFHPDGYNSDSGTALVQAPTRYRTELQRAPRLEPRESRDVPTTRGSASPSAGTGNRRLQERPLTVAVDAEPRPDTERPQSRRRSISATPTQATFMPVRRNADPSTAAFALTPNQRGIAQQSRPEAHPIPRRVHLPARRPSTPQNTSVAVTTAETSAVASAPSRGDSLRQRVANLARRNSASNNAANTAVKSDSGSAPPSVGANLGRRTREFFRRNSRSRTGSFSGTSDGKNGSAVESDNEDTSTGAASVEPKGRQRNTPGSSSIPTTIPVFSATDTSPPKRNHNDSSTARDVSREESVASSQSWRTAASQKYTPDPLVPDFSRDTIVVTPTPAGSGNEARRESGGRAIPRRGGDGKGKNKL